MVEITSRDELLDWLQDKPASWAQIIAVRTALRVLPLVIPARYSGSRMRAEAQHLPFWIFRASAISWAALNSPAHDMRAASHTATATAHAATAYVAAVRATARATPFATTTATARADAAADAATAAAAFAARTVTVTAPRAAARRAAGTAAAAADATARAAAAATAAWKAIAADCSWLDNHADSADSAAERLTCAPLWQDDAPRWFGDRWTKAADRLRSFDAGFEIWIDWYERRIRGETSAFGLPHSADEAIQVRIADQDNAWWDRGPAAVNADIKGWIAEAATQRQLPPDIEPEPQNGNVVIMKADDQGIVGVDGHAGVEELLTSDEARDRHAEAVDTARELLASCRGSNAARNLVALLDRYIEAMGARIEDCRPGLVIQRGDRIASFAVMYKAASENPASDSLLPPLPPFILLGIDALHKAHNAMVAFDPGWTKRELMLGGPEQRHNLVTPGQIRIVVQASISILTPEAQSALIDAADAAPEQPDPDNRRSLRASETVKNFARAVIAFVWKHWGKFTAGAGAGWKVAQWIVRHEAWLLNAFAGHPLMLAIIEDILALVKPLC